jgi:hypothetical protein
MTTVIKTKNSTTTTSAPSSLAQGELAVNITDKKLWVGNAATTPIQLLGAGADLSLSTATLSGNLTLSGGTTNGVLYLNGSKVATSGNALVFDGTNLGLGVTPSAWSVFKAIDLYGNGAISSVSDNLNVIQNAYYNGSNYIYKANAYAARYTQSTGQHIWYNAPSGTAGNAISFTQAMTLDASGNLLVGTTATGGRQMLQFDNASQSGIRVIHGSTTYNGQAMVFLRANNSTTMGAIYCDGANTSYSTSSDYRLKENIAPMTGALEKVAALKPCTYTWKETGLQGQGFIAHELADVVPDAVYGEKDAINEDGSINPQSIDTSFLVATLTAAIQEQQAIITDLTARLTALEAK